MKKILSSFKVFKNKTFLNFLFGFFSAIATIYGILIELFDNTKIKINIFICSLSIFILGSIVLTLVFIYRRTIFKINNIKINIIKGDIFSEIDKENSITVITCDSGFNTKVDNQVISKSSIHGQYINKYWKDNINDLDLFIDNKFKEFDSKLISKADSPLAKSKNYPLGEYILLNNNSVLLFAFTKLNKDLKATITIDQYVSTLFKLWEDLDITYSGRNIYLPLLGSGISRINNFDKTVTNILSLILATFRLSKKSLNLKTEINIVLTEKDFDEVDFHSLHNSFN